MPRQYNGGASEWSFLVEIDKIDSAPKSVSFEADAEQRADLARRLGIVSVESAAATVTLQRAGGGVVHAMGFVRADVTQACVVTLAPVPDHVEEEFEGWFGDKTSAVSFARARQEREAKKGHVEAEILEESVDPEPILNGKVDVGELATQYLSLGLNPYPHAEGVVHSATDEDAPKDEDGANLRRNPFEALKDWKENR